MARTANSELYVGSRERLDFACKVCRVQCDTAPLDGGKTVCPLHCPGHKYVYDAGDRTRYCRTCGQEPPPNFNGGSDV
jgi:hypothetical protein